MTLLIALIIGIAVGAGLGYYFLEGIDQLMLSAVAGLIGAMVGSIIYTLAGPGLAIGELFSIPGAISSLIGAILAVMVFMGIQKAVSKKVIPKM